MNIEQELKELRNKLDELEKHVKEKETINRYMPKKGDLYYYVDSSGIIVYIPYYGLVHDKYRVSVGNCFRTEEEAEKHKRILINTQKLKDLAVRLNAGQDVYWEDNSQTKWFLFLSSSEKVDWSLRERVILQGAICCLDERFLEKATEEIGRENLIELIEV